MEPTAVLPQELDGARDAAPALVLPLALVLELALVSAEVEREHSLKAPEHTYPLQPAMGPSAVLPQELDGARDAALVLVLELASVSVEAEQGKHCGDLE